MACFTALAEKLSSYFIQYVNKTKQESRTHSCRVKAHPAVCLHTVHVWACVLPQTARVLSTAVPQELCILSLSNTHTLKHSLLLWRQQQALIPVAWTVPTQCSSGLSGLNWCLASVALDKIGWGSKPNITSYCMGWQSYFLMNCYCFRRYTTNFIALLQLTVFLFVFLICH